MNPIFDRIDTLFKSLFADEGEPRRRSGSDGGPSGDSDLDEAMDELDAFLSQDREAEERLARAREARQRAEEERSRTTGRTGSAPGGMPPQIAEDYQTLGMPVTASFADVKAAYKRLLKEHHPDRHGHSPDALKRATAIASKINAAYSRIEAWAQNGAVP